MKHKHRDLLIVALMTLIIITGVASLHTITKLDEEVFVQRMGVDQFDFDEYSTFEEASAALFEIKYAFLSSNITWTTDKQGEYTVSMADLGVEIDIEKQQDYLVNFMESSSRWDKIRAYVLGKELEFTISIDPELLKAAFEESGIEQGVKEPVYYSIAGNIEVEDEQIGYGIDEDAISALISYYWTHNFEVPEFAPLPLRSKTPEVRQFALEALITNAQTVADTSLTIYDEFGDKWYLNMADHISALSPGDEQIFTYDEEYFFNYFDETLAPEVEEEAQSVVITIDENEDYQFEGSARFGRAIDKEELLSMISNELENGTDNDLALPIVEVKPEVKVPDSLAEKGVTELLGYGMSNYAGSPYNRSYNINFGVEKFNGTMIEQGAEFSFTDIMGPIDAANGWLEELVIKGQDTIPEYGGGLCQVSTTMYRAALLYGLPITLRKSHSYAVSYYSYPFGYGLDATVYDPLPDIRFQNDTEGNILIQGYTDEEDNAFFVFYGTDDGRSVQMEGPYSYDYVSISEPQIIYTDALAPSERVFEEYAHTGFQVDWYRTVTNSDGIDGEKELIHSNYEARPEKWLEGTPAEETEEP